MNGTITDVPGISVGHASDPDALTGCTVVLCEGEAVGGVDQRGGAPGTRETDLLQPLHLVQKVHGLVLAGGSAFGLSAADGVMRYLAERHIGFAFGPSYVPIVPAAVLFDLAIGRPDTWPDAEMGYRACQNAGTGPVAEGNIGAGMGCTVGKVLGPAQGTKAGIGSASIKLRRGLVVGALIAVNAFGEVLDERGNILAGARRPGSGHFVATLDLLRSRPARAAPRGAGATVIGVVATNARLGKEDANKVAQMAHDGLARAIRPAHTMYDGDTLFALATGRIPADVSLVGAYAAEAVTLAIRRAVRAASSAGGVPGLSDLAEI